MPRCYLQVVLDSCFASILKIMLLSFVIHFFCICRLEKAFDQDVTCTYFICIQVVHHVKMYVISFDLSTALMDYLDLNILPPHT